MTISAKSHTNMFDELRTAASTCRLNQIEQVRANGVGELVALPQLVVCGDQSAGKSSVLEGITGMPFPRQDGLCTRYPTEIILRHSETESTNITASIHPHSSRSIETQQTLSAYRRDLGDMSELPSVIEEVSQLLNLRGYGNNPEGRAFARDALRIEINGPIGLYLSVVDLPGLISVSNEEQTEEDILDVKEMVNSYLQNSRTIILAVLQASNDMANQGIIKLAREHDPQGIRTVGIITKPDLINRGSEARLAQTAKNQDSIKLKLGFFLLKNPSPQELNDGLTMEGRSRRELQFFSTPEWASQGLDSDRIGAAKLRLFLQELLDTHIERELPKVREEIKRILIATESELGSLGSARTTVGDMRSFLTGLSMRFYELLHAALEGNYLSIDAEFFSEEHNSRLRAHVQERNAAFAAYMRDSGQRRKVETVGREEAPSAESNEAETSASVIEPAQLLVSRKSMAKWVKKIHSRTRGKELPGNHNSVLLAELFREQSQRWPSIAKEHLHDVLGLVSRWIEQATGKLAEEPTVRRHVESIFEEWLESAEKAALEELDKLIEDEGRGPSTYNHYYTDNVQKKQIDSQKDAVKVAIEKVALSEMNGKLHISNIQTEIDKFISAIGTRITVDMDEQACSEAMVDLESYYKVAMKTFVDNVARQVIERQVISRLPEAFCPNSVSRLSDEELCRIASEGEPQTARREKLRERARGLRLSLQELQRQP